MRDEVLYNQNGIRVRPSLTQDCSYLRTRLRQADVDEILASDGITPERALYDGLERSLVSLTVLNGHPICVLGIYAESLTDDKARIWLLCSEDLFKIQTRFLRNSRNFVDYLLDYYPVLENHVDARNTKTIRWLRWLGAEVEEAAPYGVAGLNFHKFTFRR